MKLLFVALVVFLTASPTFAAKGKMLSPETAVKEIRSLLYGSASLDGSDQGNKCGMYMFATESAFSGVILGIKNSRGRTSEVSISSPDVQVYRYLEGSETHYVINNELSGNTSEIVIRGYEDISNFELTLYPGRNILSASCSYSYSYKE